jgi:FkbM family methyltransferase
MLKKAIFGVIDSMGYTVGHKNKKQASHIELLGNNISIAEYEFLFRGRDMLKQLGNRYGAKLTISKDSEVTITLHGLQFYINTWEEILILHEIFIEGMYNYETSNDYLLIDIGMNVGMTSTFHANKPNCKKVFSFEPFNATMELAKKNFGLNKCSEKVTPFNVGLGFPERVLTINYSSEYKGSVGINGIATYVQEGNKEADTATLEIKDVHELLEPIVQENASLHKVMKIDAEGVEYEILERLSATGLLKQINFLMIEWHVKGPASLEKILKENGFQIMSFNTLDKSIGMLYAFNSSAAR